MRKIRMQDLRFAKPKDCQAMLDIYAPYVCDTAISFEEEIPALESFQEKFSKISFLYPWLVLERNGQTIGYAYACAHRERSAYRFSCETSVYVDQNHHGQGIGSSLYQALFALLQAQGYCQVFAGVTQPNPASHEIHRSFGFVPIGTYQNIGYKFEAWHDVRWYQKELSVHSVMSSPIPISKLDQKIIDQCLLGHM
ncbi:MAG: N-acetyltransferase [Bdellovibrionales bacterium]|nr:N-acetyltransferase [Bdellovibrionales bacterium]